MWEEDLRRKKNGLVYRENGWMELSGDDGSSNESLVWKKERKMWKVVPLLKLQSSRERMFISTRRGWAKSWRPNEAISCFKLISYRVASLWSWREGAEEIRWGISWVTERMPGRLLSLGISSGKKKKKGGGLLNWRSGDATCLSSSSSSVGSACLYRFVKKNKIEHQVACREDSLLSRPTARDQDGNLLLEVHRFLPLSRTDRCYDTPHVALLHSGSKCAAIQQEPLGRRAISASNPRQACLARKIGRADQDAYAAPLEGMLRLQIRHEGMNQQRLSVGHNPGILSTETPIYFPSRRLIVTYTGIISEFSGTLIQLMFRVKYLLCTIVKMYRPRGMRSAAIVSLSARQYVADYASDQGLSMLREELSRIQVQHHANNLLIIYSRRSKTWGHKSGCERGADPRCILLIVSQFSAQSQIRRSEEWRMDQNLQSQEFSALQLPQTFSLLAGAGVQARDLDAAVVSLANWRIGRCPGVFSTPHACLACHQLGRSLRPPVLMRIPSLINSFSNPLIGASLYSGMETMQLPGGNSFLSNQSDLPCGQILAAAMRRCKQPTPARLFNLTQLLAIDSTYRTIYLYKEIKRKPFVMGCTNSKPGASLGIRSGFSSRNIIMLLSSPESIRVYRLRVKYLHSLLKSCCFRSSFLSLSLSSSILFMPCPHERIKVIGSDKSDPHLSPMSCLFVKALEPLQLRIHTRSSKPKLEDPLPPVSDLLSQSQHAHLDLSWRHTPSLGVDVLIHLIVISCFLALVVLVGV
ncbi:hypothetical protein VP01_611g1 [Puccinia sorghi]|uniref:Uncharacterized protein n=1 Tax=Puccinia sorghi TaxID=27349 RepID=A0A0L6UGW5_9BASI|nr:hypothetical protein VP01_611g1 [Puccinia sorghi]